MRNGLPHASLIAFLFIVLLAGHLDAAEAGGAAGLHQTGGVDQSDPIAVLQDQILKGRASLTFKPGHGFLEDLLRRLNVSAQSQILVFSKTSLQAPLIGPEAPRAIYFNDRVAIGSVQNAPVLEIMAPAKNGYVFYTLENTAAGRPRFTKYEGADCGRCHGSDSLSPGLIVASTPVRSDGTPVFIPHEGPARLFEFTDQTTPISDRWGGWYVTGAHDGRPHLGNGAVVFNDLGQKSIQRPDASTATSLAPYFDVGKYLQPTSDIVALMVFEHQARMTNLLLEAAVVSARTQRLSPAAREEILAYMLFSKEAPLLGPVTGGKAFQEAFSNESVRDTARRSLRDFDLRTRLFKYPLSYMIYSPVFDALPVFAKQDVYRRLLEILEGRDNTQPFAHLTADDRRNILEILRATKPDFADAF